MNREINDKRPESQVWKGATIILLLLVLFLSFRQLIQAVEQRKEKEKIVARTEYDIEIPKRPNAKVEETPTPTAPPVEGKDDGDSAMAITTERFSYTGLWSWRGPWDVMRTLEVTASGEVYEGDNSKRRKVRYNIEGNRLIIRYRSLTPHVYDYGFKPGSSVVQGLTLGDEVKITTVSFTPKDDGAKMLREESSVTTLPKVEKIGSKHPPRIIGTEVRRSGIERLIMNREWSDGN